MKAAAQLDGVLENEERRSTGIGSSMGQQPPNGLTLCSWQADISCCSRCGSCLYFSWTRCSAGWMATSPSWAHRLLVDGHSTTHEDAEEHQHIHTRGSGVVHPDQQPPDADRHGTDDGRNPAVGSSSKSWPMAAGENSIGPA
jgi:hypothetical protein